jgi:hypothetical protein
VQAKVVAVGVQLAFIKWIDLDVGPNAFGDRFTG